MSSVNCNAVLLVSYHVQLLLPSLCIGFVKRCTEHQLSKGQSTVIKGMVIVNCLDRKMT